MFQGLIQQPKAPVDFSWMSAPALHKRKEMQGLEAAPSQSHAAWLSPVGREGGPARGQAGGAPW